MKLAPFLLCLSALVSPWATFAASFGNAMQRDAVCGGADTAEEKGTAPKKFGEAVQGIFKAAEAQPASDVAITALQLEATRMNFIQQNRLSPVGSGEPPYRKTVDDKGNPQHIFTLMSDLTKRWEDENYVRKQVEKACAAYYPEIAEFCVDSFFKRRENIKAFLDKHKDRIEYYSKNGPKNGQSWPEHMAGENFDRDSVTDGNLRWNAAPTLPIDVVRDGFHGIEVKNEQNQVVGYMVDIEVNGVNKAYFCEIRGDEVLWPYFFIFGSASSEEWNQIFEKRHKGLRVGDLSLQEWEQLRPQKNQSDNAFFDR